MALVAETGACVASANAFVTRAEFIAFASDYYPSLTVPDDATTDAAIMRASSWLSSYIDWEGELKCGRGLQGLAWPRTGVVDCEGDAVPDDEVPFEVKQATYLAAKAELQSPGVLTPTVTPGKQRKSVSVDGAVSETYMTPKEQGVSGPVDPIIALRPVLVAVGDMLECLGSMPSSRVTSWPWVA